MIDLNRLKQELRIAGESDATRAAYTEEDEILQSAIDGAEGFVRASTGRALDPNNALHARAVVAVAVQLFDGTAFTPAVWSLLWTIRRSGISRGSVT